MVSVMPIERVKGPSGKCGAYRESLRTIWRLWWLSQESEEHWAAVISKGRVLGPPGCFGGYMIRLRTNWLAVMATVNKVL